MSFRAFKDLLLDTLRAYGADQAERLAAALAFYATFSLAPLLVLVLVVTRLLYGRQSEAAQEDLMSTAAEILGGDGAALVEGLLDGAATASGTGLWAAILSGILLGVGATALFARLQDALNHIWDVTPQHTGVWGFVWSRGRSLLLVVGTGAVLVASLLLQSALAGVADVLGVSLLLRLGGPGVSFVLLTLLLALLYRVLPDTEVHWGDVWPGALLTAGLITLGTWGFGFYLGAASVTSAYGAAGGLAAFLLWVYYSAQMFFLGAELTTVYARPTLDTPVATEHSEPPSSSPPSSDDAPFLRSPWPARLGWVAVGLLLARLFRENES